MTPMQHRAVLVCILCVLAVLMFAFLTFIPHALGPFGIAPEIIPGARDFLHGVRWGVPALTLYFSRPSRSIKGIAE